jgi:hypothetical protein
MPWEAYKANLDQNWKALLNSPDSQEEKVLQSFLEEHPWWFTREGIPHSDFTQALTQQALTGLALDVLYRDISVLVI